MSHSKQASKGQNKSSANTHCDTYRQLIPCQVDLWQNKIATFLCKMPSVQCFDFGWHLHLALNLRQALSADLLKRNIIDYLAGIQHYLRSITSEKWPMKADANENIAFFGCLSDIVLHLKPKCWEAKKKFWLTL